MRFRDYSVHVKRYAERMLLHLMQAHRGPEGMEACLALTKDKEAKAVQDAFKKVSKLSPDAEDDK